MSVTEQYTPITAVGTGNPGQEIPVPDLWFENDSQPVVTVDGVEVAWNRSASGLTLDSTAPLDSAILVVRVTPLTQDKDFLGSGRMPAADVNSALDKLTVQAQEQEEKIDRSLKTPEGGGPLGPSSTVGTDANGNIISRTAQEEIDHLGVDAQEAKDAADRAEAAADEAEGHADDAETSAGNAVAAVLDLSQKVFAKAYLNVSTVLDPDITGDVVISLPGSPDITIKNSPRPYTEPNAINGENNSISDLFWDICNIIKGDVTDYDSGTVYGTGQTTVSNYQPLPTWGAEFHPIGQGLTGQDPLVELTYYGSDEDFSLTLPFPLVTTPTTFSPPTAVPFITRGELFTTVTDHPFNADPTGVTDSTAAFQAALDTRKNVYIPVGIYRVNSTIIMRTAGQKMIGENWLKTRLQFYSTNTACLSVQRNTDTDVQYGAANTTTGNYLEGFQMEYWGADSSAVTGNIAIDVTGPNSGSYNGDFFNTHLVRVRAGAANKNWDVGIRFNGIAQPRMPMTYVQDCRLGVHIESSGVNNSFNFSGTVISQCTERCLKIDKCNGGLFQMGDVGPAPIQVEVTGVTPYLDVASFIGGNFEGAGEYGYKLVNGRFRVEGHRFLGENGVAKSPILCGAGRCALAVGNNTMAQFTGVLVLVEFAATALVSSSGGQGFELQGSSADETVWYEERVQMNVNADGSSNEQRAIGPIPWLLSNSGWLTNATNFPSMRGVIVNMAGIGATADDIIHYYDNGGTVEKRSLVNVTPPDQNNTLETLVNTLHLVANGTTGITLNKSAGGNIYAS